MCNVPSFVLCAKKNSIQHPTLDWVQIRDVGTFGKWHEGVNGGGTDGLRRADRFAEGDAILETSMLQVSSVSAR